MASFKIDLLFSSLLSLSYSYLYILLGIISLAAACCGLLAATGCCSFFVELFPLDSPSHPIPSLAIVLLLFSCSLVLVSSSSFSCPLVSLFSWSPLFFIGVAVLKSFSFVLFQGLSVAGADVRHEPNLVTVEITNGVLHVVFTQEGVKKLQDGAVIQFIDFFR